MKPDSLLIDQPSRPSESRLQDTALPTGCLILTPTDPHLAPEVKLVIEGLTQAGFLGQPRASTETGLDFDLGSNFLNLLSFTGCAVQIPQHLAKGDDRPPIRILPVSPYPRLLAGRNTRPPRCLACRAPLPNWRDLLQVWPIRPHLGISCPTCGVVRPPWLWDWKQHGGFGRLFVRIEEVFPNEATPTPALFEQLIRISGTSWRHFYLQE